MKATDPLRAEHRELLPHIEAIARTADAVGEVPVLELLAQLDAVHEFLAHHLRPHAEAEEVVLYPEVARLLGDERATDTMRMDHVEVRRLTDQLAAVRERLATDGPGDEVSRDLRCGLYGVYAILGLHFAKEEEVYLPILDDALSAEDAVRLQDAMSRAATAAAAHA